MEDPRQCDPVSVNSHLIKLYGDHLNIDLPCKLGLVAIIEYCTNQGNPP